MFGVIRRGLQLYAFKTNFTRIASATELVFNQNGNLVTLRFVSSLVNTKKRPLTAENDEGKAKRHSFTVSYLVESCGLSPDSAESAAKIIALKTQKNPDEILGILREYGCSDTHISLLVRKYPKVLLARRKTIVSKLEFLRSVGISGSDVGKMVAWNPVWLTGSLENFVIPCFGILKSVLLDDHKVCKVIVSLSIFCLRETPKSLVKNVSILKEFGLPQSRISSLLTYQPNIMCNKTEKLSRDLWKAIEYGFDPSKRTFMDAFCVISQTSPKMWEHKVAVYKSWGLSEDAIWLAFKKYPRFLALSEKNFTTTMDFLVTKMGWEPADIAKVPIILAFSLDHRIVPRCSVIKTLMLKGFIRGKVALSSILKSSNKEFLKKFVLKYKDELPHLLDIFQGRTSVPN